MKESNHLPGVNSAEEIKEMDKCITALRYELPASIIDDVESRWNKVKEAIAAQQTPAALTDGDWKLVGHSHQIADTGDYDGCWEITNGKVSIFTKDDNDEGLQPVVDALNNSGATFYLDNAAEFELYLEKQENEQLRQQLANLSTPTGEGEQLYITAGNLLIAKVMDLDLSNGGWRDRLNNFHPLSYHKSWDWLMPVYKKAHDFFFRVYGDRPICNYKLKKKFADLQLALQSGEILPTFQAIITFIEYLNSQNIPLCPEK